MRIAAVVVALLLTSAVLAADDHTVLVDPDVDFSTFKTFTVRESGVSSRWPEISSPIAIKRLTEAIRASLIAAGLKEAASAGDLLVEYDVTSVDWGIGPFGRASRINTGRGRRGGAEPIQADYIDATLVIDLEAGAPRALVWRGVFNDTEKLAANFHEALPKDAAKLLAQYPRGKK